MEDQVAMAAILCLFGWIPLKVIFNHRQRMAEIKARQVGNVDDIKADLERLRSEVKALRETATQFDISFDAALDTLQRRVDNIETRRPVATSDSASESVQRLGGGR